MEHTLTGTGLSSEQQPKVIVVASLPRDASDAWKDTGTLREVSRLPNTQIAWDVDGVECGVFGATTSGAVHLYQPGGELLFSGGVTSSRGHEGRGVGGDRVYALLSQTACEPQGSTPVFGCRLCRTPDPSAEEERVEQKTCHGPPHGACMLEGTSR